MALNPRQQRFVAEYIVDQNLTRAAERAGYSFKNAARIGSENYSKLEIREAIEKGLARQLAEVERRAAKRGLTKERWLEELRIIAFANMDDFARVKAVYASNGKKGKQISYCTVEPVPTAGRARRLGRAIKKLSETKNGIGVELHSKQAALETIGKHFGWVKDHVEMSGKEGAPIVSITLPSNGREAILDPSKKEDDEGG